MENLIFSLNATVPVFLMMILGLVFKKIGWIDDIFASKMNKFVFMVPLPVLVFEDLATVDFSKVWDVKFVLFCFIVTMISITISFLISCLLGDKTIRGEFIQAAYRSSAALLGIAFIQNIYGHSSQLDILAQDSEGRYFNVEVQRSDEGAPARRARFYSSILDTHFLQPSKLYEELPDTYVIFITENDVLRDNLPLYNIRRRIDENAKCFEDGSHIIYVNSQRRDDTALGKLMQDLYCTEPKNLHYQEFTERMEFLKYSKEGEEKMTDVIEEYAARKAEAAAKAVEEKMTDVIEEYAARKAEAVAKEASEKAQARNIELAKDLLSEGESIERTVRLSKLSEAEVRELASKLTA